MSLDCLICNKPLFEPEEKLNRRWHYDCEKCQICGNEMPNSDRILACLKDGQPVSHTTCLKTKLFSDFKTQTLPLTKSHIDALNDEINSFFPAVNSTTADVQILYDLLISLQETASNVSYALSLTKDKLLIRESQQFNHQVKEKREKERVEKIETETATLAKQEKSAMYKAEREDETGMLRIRRKAIEGFMAIGLSKEMAEQMVLAQEVKAKGSQNA